MVIWAFGFLGVTYSKLRANLI